ncbi:MAG TPA: MFS transporter [Rubrobacteraceae bacterium]|nr:MFS transporter [Rubrobacteraceae bacterium]
MSGGAVRRASGSWLFVLLLFAFGFFGLFWGAFAVLLADLSGALDLSPGPLGFALFVGAAASILAMALLGWAADRLGRRPFLVASASVFGAGIVGLALTRSYATLLVALVTLYAASGLYDVGINAAAVDLEKSTGRRFMTLLHAAFSGGGVAGALSAGALLSAGMDYRFVYLGVLIPLGAVILAVTLTGFPPSVESEGGEEIERSRLYRNVPLLLVAAIATLGLLSEGEMEHWSGIYLRQSLALPVLVGASGVAVFHAAMAVGRLGAAGVVLRFGNRRTLLGAGLLAAGGMALSLATREPLLVVAGFLVVGLALSAVVPVAFSTAGDLAPSGRAGAAISVVTTFGYGGFLLGPVIVGGLAEVFGLRVALGTIVVAGILIFAFSLRLAGRQK